MNRGTIFSIGDAAGASGLTVKTIRYSPPPSGASSFGGDRKKGASHV